MTENETGLTHESQERLKVLCQQAGVTRADQGLGDPPDAPCRHCRRRALARHAAVVLDYEEEAP